MIKVLLITSREFNTFDKNFETNFQELASYQDIAIKNTSMADEVDKNDKGKYLGLFFDAPWNLSLSILTKNETIKDKTEAVRTGIQKKNILRKDNSGPFVFGIWKMGLDDSQYIYCADEFPPMEGANKAAKFKYLNALVDEIKNDLVNTVDPIEWTIVSHDNDWDVDKSSEIIKKRNNDKPEKIVTDHDSFTPLKDIMKDVNTFIAVFQHTGISEWYQFAKMAHTMETIDVEEFQRIGKKQKEAVYELLCKESACPEDFVQLRINPNYPFIDFDKLISK